MKHLTFLLATLLLVGCAKQQTVRLNQVGYYPTAEKTAVVEGATSAEAVLVDAAGNTVWQGKAVREAQSPFSSKVRTVYDFSEVQQPGEYTLRIGKTAVPVVIRKQAFHEAAVAAMKSYYLQRTGMPIEEQYAGVYARPMAHPDTCVMIHPSAATEARPAGTIISSPYGWYDAGDFNKYIVNSGFTVGMMLVNYQLDPAAFNRLALNIPESGNGVPDYLNEIMYNLRWMATMQDPNDGGVYHKLTTPNFEGFIMPAEAKQQRYVVQKSSPAALDFAASLALASRIYAKYPQCAEYIRNYVPQAEYAYAWAMAHPEELYDQPGNNEKYEPQVNTGQYNEESNCINDEIFWAATELYLTTGKQQYLEDAKRTMPEHFTMPTWGSIAGLGSYEWFVASLRSNSLVAQEMAAALFPSMKQMLDERLAQVGTSCFQSPFGNKDTDFGWGCNGEFCAGEAVASMMAYYMTDDKQYIQGTLENMNYLFGQNATGYCYLTGFGTQQVMHSHQRISSADGIEAPLPGFLAGGPNRGQQDGLTGYPSKLPDESYLDEEPSYASNEIAINWNAPLVVALALLDNQLLTPADQLLVRLTQLRDKGIMFAHQDDPFYGISWQWQRDRSDTYELCGDYPAVMGFDLGGLEEHHDKNLDSVPFDWMREEAIKHVTRGGIITFSWHPRNPRTGGTAWDTSDSAVVKNILPGGEQHELFLGWMADVAAFLKTITYADGTPIPFIFRPWHEYNGSWFWWGQKLCSDAEYVALWKLFRDYMNAEMPNTIVWSCSPNLQGGWTEEALLARWPEGVDIVGEDCYQWGGEEDFIRQATDDIHFLSAFADKHGMLFAVTECGMQNSPVADWWSRVLLPCTQGSKALYFLPWRNWPAEHFGVAKETTTAADFKRLVAEKKVLLLQDIKK